MGHSNVNDIYRKLGKKIDGTTTRAPWNQALYEILKELYTPREAELLVRMPYGICRFEQIERSVKYDQVALHILLENLCEKGLVFDIWLGDHYRYALAPLVVGIFEMTMMRTRGELRYAEWARLFNEYLQGSDTFYAANFKHGEKVSIMRALPHEEAIDDSSFVEILDYEKATAIVENAKKFAIGLCSCRHEKLHAGKKSCNVPLDTCTSFDFNAEILVRHGLAKEVSRSEMTESIARSKELKLVLSADNVQKNVGFICQCCSCCCNLLLGVSKHGFPNAVVTSTFIAHVDEGKCTGCEQCTQTCPIKAIMMTKSSGNPTEGLKLATVDQSMCIGCGVCALTCSHDAIKLVKRKQRVLHPETIFERLILASLERGTLQNQLFNDPQSISQKFLRGFFGGFLRLPPVKQVLMSDLLRSRFLSSLKAGAQKKAKNSYSQKPKQIQSYY
jgi:Pyruvate/2-oxoacid:ferredoxin oxidoreductase delta subunit